MNLRHKINEWLLGKAGYRIWPPNHGDPRIKGPQPRILSAEAAAALEQKRRECNGEECVVKSHLED